MKLFGGLSIKKLLVITGLLFAATMASAGVKVEFVNPESFTDIKVAERSNQKSIEIIKEQLQNELAPIADKYLPEGQSIAINFTNIRLAGRIDYSTDRELRVVGENEPYSFKFDFAVKDGSGQVLESGSDKVSGFTSRISRPGSRNNSALFQEIGAMERWFKKKFN